METEVPFRNILVLVLIGGILLGSSNVTATDDLFFNEVIEIPDADGGKRTIEVDSSGNVFASFGTELYKLSDSGNVLEAVSYTHLTLPTR